MNDIFSYWIKVTPDAIKQVKKTLFRTIALEGERKLNSVETKSKMTFKYRAEVVESLVNVIRPCAFA